MKPSQWVILVLKPTPVFLSFLKSQLPLDVELPDLQLLQTDSTSYVLQNQLTDEAMLDELERQYPAMFRHEIARWLGEHARNEIEGSFLDFLCCFKFELHSHMVVMEPTLANGKQLLRIKPRSVLLKWIKSSVENEPELVDVLDRVHLNELAENATVVVKNFPKLVDVKAFMKENYLPIFEAEMARMGQKAEQWPAMDSFDTFNRYFTTQIHSQLIHLH